MSEIKITNKEQLAQWMEDNNMEVLNLTQICAILMEQDERIKILEKKVDILQEESTNGDL